MKNLEFRIENEGLKTAIPILNSQFLIAGVVFALMIFTAGIGQAEEFLQFKFKPGDKYFLLSVIEQKTIQVVDGNEQVNEQTVRIGCDLDIEEVDENDCAWARYTYRQCALNIKRPNVDIQFDSEANQPRVPAEAMPLYLVIGESLFLKITPQGRIISINGLSALLSSAKARAPLLAFRSQVVSGIDKNFAELPIRRRLEEQLAVFPPGQKTDDGNSVVGFSWSRVEEVNDEPKQIQLWLYQLKQRRDGIAFIDVNVAISPPADLDEVVTGGVKARREVSGKGSGTVEIEEATGRIINEKVTRETVDEIKASPQGPVLRLPILRPPVTIRTVTNFQMTKRQDSSTLSTFIPPEANKP